ncbi:hypothetical protein [Kitasatospora sp. GAS1066B]|uniref:hypothetical protein n=1 Tax=Kitasatospora sp. GAS1066B TaxID=3156271 RepID=UPI003513410E
MPHKSTSRAAAIAMAVGIAGAVCLPATSAQAQAQASSSTVTLPLAHYSHILIDSAHRHLFISGGTGSTSILVTDYSGRTVTTVDNEPGATGLALSSDGRTVYAALADGDAVSAISTRTLTERARYATGAGTDPMYVAYTGGEIWFGYGVAAHGGIGSIDPSSGPAAVTLAAAPGSWYAAPLLAAGPNGELVAGEPGQSPDQLASYDVSSGTASVLAAQRFVQTGGNLANLQLTPDGSEVVTASGYPYYQQVFKVSDLTPAGQYNSTNYPDAVSVAADGTVLAGVDNPSANSIYVFAPGNPTPLKAFSLSGPPAPAGLAVTPDGTELFAISGDASGHPVLNILPNPEQVTSGLSLTGPTSAAPESEVTLTGTLAGSAPYAAGQSVHVSRVDADDPDGVSLPNVTTATDGSFSVTDTPCATGSVSYQVSYDGDAHLAAAQASATVSVGR